MKKIQLALLLFFSAFASYAQVESKVIAVVTKANWCPACVKNEVRIGSEVMSKINLNDVLVVMNDLTDDTTKRTAEENLKNNGLENLKLKTTGVISFIDPKTKKVISSISVAEPSDKIVAVFTELTSK